jgi:hypothetical protein
LGKEHTCLDGGWGELKAPILNITDRKNVRDIGLLILVDNELAILLAFHASCLQVETLGYCVATDCEQNGIKLTALFTTIVMDPSDLNWSVGVWFLELRRRGSFDELGVV